MTSTSTETDTTSEELSDLAVLARVADGAATARRQEMYGCDTCRAYLDERKDVVAHHIVKFAHERGLDPVVLAVRFRVRLHNRHLSGLSLAVNV